MSGQAEMLKPPRATYRLRPRMDTTLPGLPVTMPVTCCAHRSNAARRLGSSSLRL
jgi:hypothetical protein